MYGRNPKTGKPIRLLKSESSIWKNQKTLVWLHDTLVKKNMDRWETVCVGMKDFTAAKAINLRVDAIILLENSKEEIQFLKQKHLHGEMMIFLSQRIVFIMGDTVFAALQLRNVICLEEITDVFPFVGKPWNGSKIDALHMMSLILRTHRFVGIDESTLSPERIVYTKKVGNAITCMSDATEPPQLWFLTQYYKPNNLQREKEIKKCLELNLENPLIDKIILLNEKKYQLVQSSKLEQIVHGKRLTYGETIKWFQDNAPPNTICVFANSDIFLDESWLQVWSTNLEDKFLSLLRYDVQKNGKPSVLFGPRADSQDTWAFLSDTLKTREFNWKDLDFPFGQSGCDNAINVEMLRKKFLVVNPSLSLKTHHLHISEVRTYDPSNVVDKPMYFYVDPTGIHDMEPVTDLTKHIIKTHDVQSFTRSISSISEKNLDIFCTMLAKQEAFTFDRLSTNEYKPKEKIQFYKFENCFHTAQGLVYDTRHIFVGKIEESKIAWSKARISPLSTSFYVKKTLSVILPEETLKTPEIYLLNYISKILLLKKEVGSGEFWMPQKENFTEALQIFNWSDTENVPVLPIASQAQAWSNEVYQWAPQESALVTKEQIDILRESLYAPPLSAPPDGHYVIVTDEFCNASWVTELEQESQDVKFQYIYIGKSSTVNILGKLRNAAGMIFRGGPNTAEKWSIAWMLPKGAQMIEIQNEMEQSGEAIHIAGACGLKYSLITIPRGKSEFLQMESVRLVIETLKPHTIDTSLPVIYMPRKSLTGLYSHSGDSFRELVRLWADKKYVRIEEHPTAVQIWLHAIGHTLLYDRPTLEWLQAAPPDEQTWKKALFGNPPAQGDDATAWTFWARRPELLEEFVKDGLGTRGYNQRKHLLVFYGKIENKVQERRRKTHDWESACTDFIMPNGGDYKLTHYQYLEKLADAKYGLCLAGYGKKCHRETECMALGTVPVVAADVDMSNYANPPIEGIHYIRVQDPAEADKKTEETTEEKWLSMSMACKEWWLKNCSVEGSWLLTKRLTETIKV